MASLAEVAARAPQDIKNMFTYDGTTVDNGATVGLYTVRLFDTHGFPVYLQVDTDLPSGGGYYAHVSNALGTSVLWVALAEKAYAEANSLGYVTTQNENQDSYDAMNGGWPAWALQAITGQSATKYSTDPTKIASAWNAGQLIVLCTSSPASSYIVGSHCYAVVGYNASSGLPFEVFNAWGTESSGWAPGEDNKIYGLFDANAAFISQNFSSQTFGTGAIDVNNVNGSANRATGSATLGDGSAASGTTGSTRDVRGGQVADTAAATSYGSGGTATGYTRPAQGMSAVTDLWDISLTGGDHDPGTRGKLRLKAIG
jgi:hypothetical protein